jgi:hypothetical protein
MKAKGIKTNYVPDWPTINQGSQGLVAGASG